MEIAFQPDHTGIALNIWSIVLGLAALGFAIHSFAVKDCLLCSVLSLSCVGASLTCQLMDIAHLAAKPDFAAIDDTIRARVMAAVVLLGCAAAINLAAWLRGRNQFRPAG